MKALITKIFSWISDHLRLVLSFIFRLEIGTKTSEDENSKEKEG